MKKDPVLDYAEKLIKFIRKFGMELSLPKDFAKNSEDSQRTWIYNLQNIATNRSLILMAVLGLDSSPKGYPEISEEVDKFLQGGPRPPITG